LRLFHQIAMSFGPKARLGRLVAHVTAAPLGLNLPVEGGLPQEALEIFQALDRLKSGLFQADCQATEQGKISEGTFSQLVHLFAHFFRVMNNNIGDRAVLSKEDRKAVGRYVQREMLPIMALAPLPNRMYTKPCGYAGDYLTIKMMYDHRNPEFRGEGNLGPIFHELCLKTPAFQAVCNRRGLLANEVADTIAAAASEGRAAQITSLACGPAQEIFDIYETLPNPASLQATLLDIDKQALELISATAEEQNLTEHLRLRKANLVHLALGRRSVDVQEQDLVYTIGLIDYFDDDMAVKLLSLAYDMLRPGGRVIVGNFHTSNPDKAFMDYVMEWRLVHRDETKMHALFQASKFGKPCDQIQFEAAGVNLFAECSRS